VYYVKITINTLGIEESCMIVNTAARVQQHTASDINRQFGRELEEHVAYYRQQTPDRISERLQELDHEWDIERTLQTNFATLSIVGALLTRNVSERWAILALGVPAFMIQHALQGWCPPLPALRRLGVRTAREISDERFALKALRGDFNQAEQFETAEALLTAVRK
jgi:hypothetical protein